MRKYFLLILVLTIIHPSHAQVWNNSNSTTTSDFNTSIQLTYTGWGAQHGILFNAYKSSTLVDGPLTQYGNTKNTFNAGPWGSGAGAIAFLANGGRMDFLISGNSTGAGTNVDWGVPKMCIERNGNVGIGTTSTDFRLTVNGKIKAEEIQVVVDVADYVFADDYKLPSLQEVEAYIKQHKHLPGVPGKAEVDTNGFEVGQMTNKVLEKVEELTLYVIELKKENEALKARLEQLENKSK